MGSIIYDLQNRDIGSVKDVILDIDGRDAAVVVEVGAFLGMGGKDVAVRPNQINTDGNRLTLDPTRTSSIGGKATGWKTRIRGRIDGVAG